MVVNSESLHRRQLARQLDTLVAKANRHLRRWLLLKDLQAALEPALKLLVLALAIVLALQIIALAGGLSLVLPGFWSGALFSLCLPLVYLGTGLTRTYRFGRVQRAVALALYDRLLGLKDCLATADEFLRCRHIGAFSDAAIDDAEPVIGRALDVELPKAKSAWQPLGRHSRYYVCAAVLLMLVMLEVNTRYNVTAGILSRPLLNHVPAVTVQTSADGEPSRSDYPSENGEPARNKEHSANETVLASESSLSNNATRAGEASKPVGTDLASQAQSDSNIGDPSFRQSGAGHGEASKSDKERSAKDSTQVDADQNLPTELPISARQSKKQQVAGSASESSSNDSSQSGEKGTMQSLLARNSLSEDRQNAVRKSDVGDSHAAQSANNKEARPPEKEQANQGVPPTSQSSRRSNSGKRGQTPRASNNQNSDMGKGNGNKGHGKGSLKKSRGVMSMILGVPTPDRIWGQTNPAPIRMTRQRAQPEEKNVDSTEAQDRSPRATPLGHLVNPQPSAWEEQLLRAYFNEQRRGDTGN